MEALLDAWVIEPLSVIPHGPMVGVLAVLVLVAWIANWVTRVVLHSVVGRIVRATPTKWDDAMLERHVLARLANIIPAVLVFIGIAWVPGLSDWLLVVVRKLAGAYVVFTIAIAIRNLINAINDIYERSSRHAARRPIKGYLQLLKMGVYVIALVLIVAWFIERSPAVLLTGFGAMAAVLMLVFKDTLLSLVASIQLASNDMLRIGDWIEMPSQDADGDVIDISLHTVKVQNFDKTISTIPTWKLVDQSFRNWRGMREAGGRRIKRSLYLDQTSVHFLDAEAVAHLRRLRLIDDYLLEKVRELEDWNRELGEWATLAAANQRRMTNLGTFRAYTERYLRAHPGVNQDLSVMVRQLQPGSTGLPLEIYCFTTSVQWVVYEGVQSDIFDHLLAVLPEFGLRVFQTPSGFDLRHGVNMASLQQRAEAGLQAGAPAAVPESAIQGDGAAG